MARRRVDAAVPVGRLHASEREARILEASQNSGFVSITELAEEFGVSTMTVRRDLTALGRRGLLRRTHGGAVGASPVGVDVIEPRFEDRARVNAEAKAAIAHAAARLIGPSESVGLDVGTTTLALARMLSQRRDLQIFTSSLHVASQIAAGSGTAYVLAGRIRPTELSIVGPQAIQSLSAHFLDRVFLGVSGIDASGVYDYSPEDTEVKRAWIEHSGRRCILCDSSKFERRSLSTIAALDCFDVLVTDRAPLPDLSAALARAGVGVVVAGKGSEAATS